MKATLKLENIGQKIGKEVWEFNSGVLTEIRGRTASGKSRIIKSCSLALALPISSEDIRKNAISFGIEKADNAEYSPLLNSNKDRAIIELQYDDILKIVELKRDGTETINTPGNQIFLYCSMLVENSKIHSYIDQGISDFSWIVTEMSLAKDYETIQEIIKSYTDLLTSLNDEIKGKIVEKNKNQELLKQKNKVREKILSDIKEIEKEIDAIEREINPQLRGDKQKLVGEIAKLKNKLKEENKKNKDLQDELTEIEKNLNKNNDTIEENRKKIRELEEKKKSLQRININNLNNEINKLHQRNEVLYEKQKEILPKFGGLELKKKERQDILNQLDKKGKEEALCWICNETMLSREKIKKQLDDLNSEIEPLIEERKEIEEEIKNNKAEIIKKQERKKDKEDIPKIKKQADKIFEITQQLQKDKLKGIDKKNEILSEIEQYTGAQNTLEDLTKQIQEKETEKKKIEDQIKGDDEVKDIYEDKDKLTKKLGSIENEILNLENKINDGGNVEILGIKIDISKANDILKDLEEIFNSIEDHTSKNIKQQREGAALKFNENIKKIINELNFTEFKEISLALEDYNLNIIRKDDTAQPINSLSGGEKVVVSSLLQISAKETYNPEIPFIIGDDIILKMDDGRREVFYDYLKTIAKENDWFVILTRVTDEDLIKEEV